MNARTLCSRILVIVGGIAMLVGAIDPLEGSVLILPGSALVALIAETRGMPDQLARIENYVGSLRAACVASKAC